MRTPTCFKWMLVLSAYLPLFVLVALLNAPTPGASAPARAAFYVALGAIGSSVSSVLLLYVRLSDVSRRRSSAVEFAYRVERRRDGDVLTYFVALVIPLLAMPHYAWTDLVALILTVALVLWLSARSDLLYVNPTLFLLGYHFYSISIDNGRSALLISKEALPAEGAGRRTCSRLDEWSVLLDLTKEMETER